MSNLDSLVLAIPLFFAVAFGAAALYEMWIDSRLRTDSKTAEGNITELRRDSRLGLIYTFIEYNYRIGTDEYSARQAVTADHFERLKEGDLIAVNYVPSNPAISRMAGSDQDNANRRSMINRALVLFAVWVILMVAVRR